MTIETVGHAGMLLRDEAGRPLLFTDPWVIGSCYWRSWWLQNYPSPEQVAELRAVPFCYITHEHPDHFHTASIRALGHGPHYLTPDLPHARMATYLREQGHRVSTLPPFSWKGLNQDVQVLSVPLLNDDSVLLVSTPTAVIVNLNDSKPRPSQLRQLADALDAIAAGRRRILLSSYSPASIVNSFLKGARRISLRAKASYAQAVSEICRVLKIDDFMPFASQVIFKRTDSAWANEFKVQFEELQRYWTGAPTRLLPPFSTIDLRTGTHTAISPDHYRHDDATMVPKVAAQEALDTSASFDDADIARLRAKLAHCRLLLAVLFPAGIGFELERTPLTYSPWSGRVTRGRAEGTFIMRVPAQAFKDAIAYGHFGDLGTTMFTIIVLNRDIHPRRVYALFLLLTLHDYGHTTSLRRTVEWLARAIGAHRWRIPPIPPRAEAIEA